MCNTFVLFLVDHSDTLMNFPSQFPLKGSKIITCKRCTKSRSQKGCKSTFYNGMVSRWSQPIKSGFELKTYTVLLQAAYFFTCRIQDYVLAKHVCQCNQRILQGIQRNARIYEDNPLFMFTRKCVPWELIYRHVWVNHDRFMLAISLKLDREQP